MSRISVNFASEISLLKETLFNMTREGDEDIEGGTPKIFRQPKGGL